MTARHFRFALASKASEAPGPGLRLGLTVSLILAVVCEMIAGLDGLGQWVLLAARAYKSADIFAGVVLLGAIGVVANATLSLVEARALRWAPRLGRCRTSRRGETRPWRTPGRWAWRSADQAASA